MNEFFAGWRRKIGVLTLLMACAFLGMWFRSFTTTTDHISVWKQHYLYSHSGSISWNVDYHDDSPVNIYDAVETLVGRKKHLDPLHGFQLKARWEFCGLVYSDQVIFQTGTRQYWITYWYFVTPLTLLSAFLLLSKSHKSRP